MCLIVLSDFRGLQSDLGAKCSCVKSFQLCRAVGKCAGAASQIHSRSHRAFAELPPGIDRFIPLLHQQWQHPLKKPITHWKG